MKYILLLLYLIYLIYYIFNMSISIYNFTDVKKQVWNLPKKDFFRLFNYMVKLSNEKIVEDILDFRPLNKNEITKDLKIKYENSKKKSLDKFTNLLSKYDSN